MTITLTARITALAGGAVLTLGLMAGCNGSKANSAPPAGTAGLPTSTAGVGNNGSPDAKICAAIAGDVAAITKNVSTPATFPGQCSFGGGATTVSFNLNDADHSDVTEVISGSSAHTISGFGDGAVWEDGIGEIVPSLGAWKGNVSCLVQPDSDITNDNLAYTGNPPLVKIADGDAAAYAAKLGAVCNDLFSAAS